MLTPVDLQNKVFKGGIGFDKKDVESFMHELSSDYEQLYRSNVELTDKVATLNESLQHYKSVEDSMQKALTLSEKTAEETINAANDKARLLTTEAEKKAENILADAKQELEDTKNEIFRLQQQQKKFKEQFTHVLESQLKMMDGEMIDIDLGDDFQPASSYDSGFGNFSGGGLGSEGGLGGGLGGGYVGSGSNSFERTNQEPAFDRGSLNMDPFADAANGGGRFSRQTGGSYNGSKKKAATTKSDSGKSSLNMKKESPEARRVKRTPIQQAETPLKEATIHTANSASTASATPVTPKPQATPVPDRSQAAPEPAKERVTMAAKASEQANAASRTQTPFTQQNTSVPHPTDEPTVSGEVEEKVNESTMLDSEDNYNTGFDFVEEADTSDVFVSDQPVSGEVEDKVDESTMLDSEDNYTTGFDFVEDEDTTISSGFAQEEDTYSGEVEDKVNESNMLDSEDNYNDGFDFVVGNEQEEEIPTILGNGGAFTETAGAFQNTGLNGSSFTTSESLDEGLNIDPFKESAATTTDEDVLTGDVEDKLNESTLLGNDDDTDEGFNFL